MARVLGGVVLDGGDGRKDLITGAVFACLLKHHWGGGELQAPSSGSLGVRTTTIHYAYHPKCSL